MKTNSMQAWVETARPKTLAGATIPVIIAIALAAANLDSPLSWKYFFLPALLCLLFAALMQIDANFINDYIDNKKGSDTEERLGPERACIMGWITEKAIRRGIAICTATACVIGLPLIYYGGWWMLAVGILCVAFAALYSMEFSYLGAGDILVFVFFGLVPVCVTYYILTHSITAQAVLAGAAIGLVIDNMLIVNNYRDREQDAASGKNTIIVRCGAKFGEAFYLMNGIAAVAMCFAAYVLGCATHCSIESCICLSWLCALPSAVLPALYLISHIRNYKKMKEINHGKELNVVFEATAKNIIVFGVLLTAGVILSAVLDKLV